MELRHLRYFLAVADALNFSRAAERLHLSQPPLSQQVRRLEAELGAKLFDRSKRQIKLTAAGEIFATKARAILAQCDEAAKLAARAERGEFGHLRLGLWQLPVPPVQTRLIIECLRAFVKRSPDVHLTLQSLLPAEQIKAVKDGGIDVGIVRLPVAQKSRGIEIETILREPMVLAMSENNSLARFKTVPLRELSNQRYIMFGRDANADFHHFIARACRKEGFSLNIAYFQDDLYSVWALIGAGLGVALAPASLQELRLPGIVFRKFEPAAPVMEMALAHMHTDKVSVVSQFLEVARKIAKAYSGGH
ncbi:MAG TPA: LysR substrate-binding domain-containing protein [Verrucomicrobiae bacterium]|nr:LysR substrate-binding domain-containing protein [Verrucomicrobiae bacterium]